MHPIDEQDLQSLILMVSGLFMSAYGQLAKHTGFVFGGFIFFYMGVMILRPLPKDGQSVKTADHNASMGGGDGEPGFDRADRSNHRHSGCDGGGGPDGLS